jgi:5-methylcytosine-specific restriction endonuclease McrA
MERANGRDEQHRRRAAKRNAKVEKVNAIDIFNRDNWTCQLCGEPVQRDAKVPHFLAPTLDHIVPLAKGGSHTKENLQLAHFICNSRKSDREVGQFSLSV